MTAPLIAQPESVRQDERRCCEVPPHEQLQRIPQNAVIQWTETDGLKATCSMPIGLLVRRAFTDYDRLLQQLKSSEAREAELVASLMLLYDKWENGDPCYQNGDVDCDSLGNAFKLTDEEETRVLEALEAAGVKTALTASRAAITEGASK